MEKYLSFTAVLKQFAEQGEKTGWTYFEVPADIATGLFPNNKKSFQVKGKIDNYPIEAVSLLPMGNGGFIMAVNAAMRRGIRKKKGATVEVTILHDKKGYQLNADLINCLSDDPEAAEYFESLATSHKNYFSKWIDAAKTDITKAKRISACMDAFTRKWNYSEMIRVGQGKPLKRET